MVFSTLPAYPAYAFKETHHLSLKIFLHSFHLKENKRNYENTIKFHPFCEKIQMHLCKKYVYWISSKLIPEASYSQYQLLPEINSKLIIIKKKNYPASFVLGVILMCTYQQERG